MELLTIGTWGVPGADATHLNRPTYIDFFPNGDLVVADGYNGTRVVKFDNNGKFIKDWGMKGSNQNDTRPNYFNNVHGVAVDPMTRRVYVNDRGNKRAQVFDKDGDFVSQFKFGDNPSRRPHVPHLVGSVHLGRRSRHEQDAQVRPRGALPVCVGHVGVRGRAQTRRTCTQRRSGQPGSSNALTTKVTTTTKITISSKGSWSSCTSHVTSQLAL